MNSVEIKLRAEDLNPSVVSQEPGSFRDRLGRVFYADDAVLRGLGEQALLDWDTLAATRFFQRFTADGKLVRTERLTPSTWPNGVSHRDWACVLRHERISFVSYPYEWTFGMLKDAAMLQLELLLVALDEGMILKDASAFNVQWVGSNPTFIDIPSFERFRAGQPWVGYRQFCQLCLYPLLLQAYKNVPFHPWLRGSIDGIEPAHMANLLSGRDLLRPGVATHVFLQSWLQQSHGGSTSNMAKALKDAGFEKSLIQANARKLLRLVSGLSWKPKKSTWADYATTHSYDDDDMEAKRSFVRRAVATRPWNLVWDLGSNTGNFSRLAAANAKTVIAMEGDHAAADRLYMSCKAEPGNSRILPLVINLADPTPPLGWRGQERKTLSERGKPDLVLCLALIHHMVIGANVPMLEFVDWLRSLDGALVIEFVTKDDEMVRQLLRNKDDIYDDYELAVFEEALDERFAITDRQVLKSGRRVLYFATPKA